MAYRDSQPRTIHLRDYQVPDFLIDRTELTVELGEDRTRVSATLSMRRNPDSEFADAPLQLHGADLDILSLALDGEPLEESEYRHDGELLSIDRPVGERFRFHSEVAIDPRNNTSLEGLYKSRSMFCTQCEAEGFRKITFYLDRPDVMSEFVTTIIADKSRYPVLLANGNPVERADLDYGRHQVTWHDPFPKPSYLFAMVAGDLACMEDSFTTASGREVALRLFVEEKDLDKGDFALASLKKAMRWDEEVFGREYDLDIFMIVAVDDFNMGAMENKGLNIFNTAAVLAKPEITTDTAFQTIQAIVAHEYFHNWSGNRVTCRDWFQLSLKEGFTVFRDSLFSEDMASPVVKRIQDVNMLRTLQFSEDAGPMAHPVQPASYMEISNFYTLTVYEKGCEVVRMIHTLLGPEQFRRGSDLYFARHDGQAVTIEDFVRAMSHASGRDFHQFMCWYKQAGTPFLDVSGEYDAETRTYSLHFRQSCKPTPEAEHKRPFLIPVRMGLVGRNGDLPLFTDSVDGERETVLEVTEPEQTFVFTDVPEEPLPSLLRGFSAPVKWHFPYTRNDLLSLMVNDSDGFNRWDACNQLASNILREMIEARVEGREVSLDERLGDAFDGILADRDLDPAVAAQMLTLPTEAYLGEIMDVIHVRSIHEIRLEVRQALARTLRDQWLACFEAHQTDEPYRPEPDQIARRSLKNVALGYLALAGEDELLERIFQQAVSADNMTDTQAALVALLNTPAEGARERAGRALEVFYERWQHEPLAVNSWLSMQASAMLPGGLERVQMLMEHEAFDIRNPNRVRSLIGAFCNANLINFHREDGAGYRFLGDRILELEALNPQVAARQVTPLTRWRKYPPELAEPMKEQLNRIAATEDLSPDVYEVVSKSL